MKAFKLVFSIGWSLLLVCPRELGLLFLGLLLLSELIFCGIPFLFSKISFFEYLSLVVVGKVVTLNKSRSDLFLEFMFPD